MGDGSLVFGTGEEDTWMGWRGLLIRGRGRQLLSMRGEGGDGKVIWEGYMGRLYGKVIGKVI